MQEDGGIREAILKFRWFGNVIDMHKNMGKANQRAPAAHTTWCGGPNHATDGGSRKSKTEIKPHGRTVH